MCVGVATANSILVVSFAKEELQAGLSAAEAAVHANYPDCGALLLVELDGPAAEVQYLMTHVNEICRSRGAWEIHNASTFLAVPAGQAVIAASDGTIVLRTDPAQPAQWVNLNPLDRPTQFASHDGRNLVLAAGGAMGVGELGEQVDAHCSHPTGDDLRGWSHRDRSAPGARTHAARRPCLR